MPPPHPCAAQAWGSLERSWNLGISALGVSPPRPRGLPGLCLGRQGAWRGCARGHHQLRVSFHLCEDSLTPEHINILNDPERSRDSRRPAPSTPPCPFLSLIFLPCSLAPCLLSPSLCFPPFCLLCLGLFHLLFLSFLLAPPLPSPPLPSGLFPSSSAALVHSQTSSSSLGGVGERTVAAGPVPLSVHPQLSPSALPGGWAHTVGPRQRPHLSFLPFAQRRRSFSLPLPHTMLGNYKAKFGCGVPRERGEFGEDFLFCIFYDHI